MESWSPVSYPLGRSYEEASLARAEGGTPAGSTADCGPPRSGLLKWLRARAGRLSASKRSTRARGATLAQERLDVEQRRYDVGLSTTFLVTQAQRDLLESASEFPSNHAGLRIGHRELRGGPASAAACRGRHRWRQRGQHRLDPLQAPRGIFRPGAGIRVLGRWVKFARTSPEATRC
jgi:hypothetical protein